MTGKPRDLGPFVYALFGSSRQLVVGPEGTLAALTAVTVAPSPPAIRPLRGVTRVNSGSG